MIAFVFTTDRHFQKILVILLFCMVSFLSSDARGSDIESYQQQAIFLHNNGKTTQAIALQKRIIAASKLRYGKVHIQVAAALSNLAFFLDSEGHLDEAENIYYDALEMINKIGGTEHWMYASILGNIAGLHWKKGDLTESEFLLKQTLEIQRKLYPPGHTEINSSLRSLAYVYLLQDRFMEAKLILQSQMNFDKENAGIYSLLGRANKGLGNYDAAALQYKQAINIREEKLKDTPGYSSGDPSTSLDLADLAEIYASEGRFAEAEALVKRAVSIQESIDPTHPDYARVVGKLGLVYQRMGRIAEAAPLLERWLDISEQRLGPSSFHMSDRPRLVLANIYLRGGFYRRSEELYKKALSRYLELGGSDNSGVANSRHGLGLTYLNIKQFNKSESNIKSALQIYKNLFGPEHPIVAHAVNDLARIYFTQGQWEKARINFQKGNEMISSRGGPDSIKIASGLQWSAATDVEIMRESFMLQVKVDFRDTAGGQNSISENIEPAFISAQYAWGSTTAVALARMAVRQIKDDSILGRTIRERQDLTNELSEREALRSASLARSPFKRNKQQDTDNLVRIANIENRIAKINDVLSVEFPDYTALANPAPLEIEDLQTQLGEDEALVLSFDTRELKPTPEETFIWVVTKDAARWVRSDLGTDALTKLVSALRCGLDEEQWSTPTRQRKCADLLGLDAVPDPKLPLPFDLGKAHELYQALFGQVEDLIAGKRLLIVPSGPLTSLPFHVLVTKQPKTERPATFEAYRDVAWLARSNAIVTLPAVSSLKALRQHARNGQHAPDDYIGYGNPVLTGENGTCRTQKVPDKCPSEARIASSASAERAIIRGGRGRRSGGASTDAIYDKGATAEAILKQVRALCPLPDTAYEIQCVAERYKDKARLIRLDAEAREPELKVMSESGELASYRILHFATHGLLSGDVERMAKRQGEPALVLTPPDDPVDADDDGLLMASEVASLKLNADWIVLSACNTAAGDDIGAEALSGLARAFFYAGGRTLLVSHWPVYSDAAVRLITHTFAELDGNPKAGRAEALQQAMIALMDDPSQVDNPHPAVWAPFVVVGEGAR